MKIAYNPTGGSALSKSQIDSLKNDIIFDLSGMAVYARGIPVGKVYLPFEKSTSSTTEGYNGLVPFPDYNSNSKTRFLREDGTWVVPTNTNNYRPISVNGTSILGNNNTALNLVAGTNITLSPKKDSNNKYTGEVTITANAIGIKDLSGTSFSTYLKSSITYGYNSDETKKDNIVGDFGIFNMQTSSYTESNHFYFRQFRGQARIDKLYTRLYYKRENEDIKYTDWKEILKLGDYTTLAGYGITDAVKKVSNVSADVSESCVGYTTSGHDGKENGGMFTALGETGLYGSQLLGGYTGKNLYYRGKNNGDWTNWKKVAFTDSNVASATKLATPRLIWGQSFDGTKDVSGDLKHVTTIHSTNYNGLRIAAYNLAISPTSAGNLGGTLLLSATDKYGLGIWNDGNGKSYLQVGRTDGTNTAYNLILQHLGGNVGIGTISPTEKLEVSGNIKATSFLGNLDGSYINKLTGYTKATTSSDITANDTLNAALGKLELKADTAYDLVKGAYNGDGTIENLAEILKVLEGISDTDTIKSLLGKYRRLDKDEFYGSEVHSKFWTDRTIEGGGGWAYVPILVFKADKETKLLNIGVYGNNSDLIYSYIGSNDHNSTKNLRIYPDGTVTASKFITSGGTASQFVKGDGSLDSTSYVIHNAVVKNVPSLTRSTLGYAYNAGENADTFWYTAGPVALFGRSKYLCAIQADASNNNVIKYKKVVNGSVQESWKTFVNSDGTQIGSSVRPVYVKNDGSVAPFTLSNATANDTRNILVGYDNGIYLVTSAKINPSTGILIANGFVKSGSTDSHVLLGAGGHKALSDFMMKGDDLAAHTITITKSIKLTKDWQETGIVINDATFTEGAGTYAVQVDINAGEATGFWYSLFSGIASFQTFCTNGTEPDDEILLHHSSHGCSKQIYLKTKPTQGGLGYYNKLYIACNTECSTAVNIKFKFKKLI